MVLIACWRLMATNSVSCECTGTMVHMIDSDGLSQPFTPLLISHICWYLPSILTRVQAQGVVCFIKGTFRAYC
jgi:hypothetical protein